MKVKGPRSLAAALFPAEQPDDLAINPGDCRARKGRRLVERAPERTRPSPWGSSSSFGKSERLLMGWLYVEQKKNVHDSRLCVVSAGLLTLFEHVGHSAPGLPARAVRGDRRDGQAEGSGGRQLPCQTLASRRRPTRAARPWRSLCSPAARFVLSLPHSCAQPQRLRLSAVFFTRPLLGPVQGVVRTHKLCSVAQTHCLISMAVRAGLAQARRGLAFRCVERAHPGPPAALLAREDADAFEHSEEALVSYEVEILTGTVLAPDEGKGVHRPGGRGGARRSGRRVLNTPASPSTRARSLALPLTARRSGS